MPFQHSRMGSPLRLNAHQALSKSFIIIFGHIIWTSFSSPLFFSSGSLPLVFLSSTLHSSSVFLPLISSLSPSVFKAYQPSYHPFVPDLSFLPSFFVRHDVAFFFSPPASTSINSCYFLTFLSSPKSALKESYTPLLFCFDFAVSFPDARTQLRSSSVSERSL
jgi:hypothetical protein